MEDMEELDDSFDRRIAASLEVARPLEIQAQFLVRLQHQALSLSTQT